MAGDSARQVHRRADQAGLPSADPARQRAHAAALLKGRRAACRRWLSAGRGEVQVCMYMLPKGAFGLAALGCSQMPLDM